MRTPQHKGIKVPWLIKVWAYSLWDSESDACVVITGIGLDGAWGVKGWIPKHYQQNLLIRESWVEFIGSLGNAYNEKSNHLPGQGNGVLEK